jgi:lipopolysaccharide export system permease protein
VLADAPDTATRATPPMRSLSYYILRQIVGPLLLFTLLMTIVVWLTQSLRLLDLVINRGQSAATFAYLTLLLLPGLLAIIVPVAFFAGTMFALHKLNTDSELVVMWSAGFSRLQIATPVMIAAAGAMVFTYMCSLWLMPLGQRTMKDKVFDIRSDIGAAILREGEFTTPGKGLTVFIRELTSGGELRGILVHDNRDAKHPTTYLAETGLLAQTTQGARLIMQNGNIERSQEGGARLSLLRFDNYVFNLDQFAASQRTNARETSERYLDELFFPPPDTKPTARNIYFAEAHNRLSSPLYCLVFALIAMAATAKAHLGRTGYALRLLGATLAAVGLRLIGYGAQGLAAASPELVAVLYLIPISGGAVAAAVLADLPLVPAGIRRLFFRPSGARA